MVKDDTQASKWDPAYKGPFTVIKQTRGGNYILQDMTGYEIAHRFTIDKLKIIDGTMSSGERKEDPRIQTTSTNVSPVNTNVNQNNESAKSTNKLQEVRKSARLASKASTVVKTTRMDTVEDTKPHYEVLGILDH